MTSARATPKRTGIDLQPMRPIEVEVLAGIEHVEPADPGADRERQQPGLPAAAAARGEPSADRRDGHGQAEEQLRVAGEAFRQRIPEHDRQRDRRQRETERRQLPRGKDEHR